MRAAFSVRERGPALDGLGATHFDLAIIGGGITGAGVFRDAVMRGLKVLLIERDDFGSGTSSKSSKLVHGGLRYLERFHIRLTRESCRERELLIRLNPHLVRPMPFLFPLYRDSRLHPLFIRMGLRFYEYLAGGSAIPHRMLKPSELSELAPKLRTENLRRAALYYDSTVDDARLVVANVVDGVARGGTALNYTEVVAFAMDGERINAIELRDREGGQTCRVGADHIVNAAGIACDEVRGMAAPVVDSELRASKGVHIVVSGAKLPIKSTVAFMNRPDGRLLFAIPWGDVVLVGTTDTFDQGDVRTTSSVDLEYLLEALKAAFKDLELDNDDVISSIAGVRTLVVDKSKSDESATAVSREHAIYEDPSGLVSVAGGKLTTYRLMSKDIVDLIVERLEPERRAGLEPCSTDSEALGGEVEVEAKERELQERYQVSAETAQHLVRNYGGQAHEPLEVGGEIADGLAPLLPGEPFLRCEIPYVTRTESAVHLEDVLTRRLRAAVWSPGQALAQAPQAAALMAPITGWDEAAQAAEAERYRALVRREFRPI